MTITLNQILDRLQKLALSHKQIRSFYYYDIVDTLTINKGVLYPAMFVDHEATRVSKTDHQIYYKFTFYICDLYNIAQDAQKNYVDVESDLHTIAMDYYAMVHSALFYDSWTPQMDISIEFMEEEFEDMVGAVKFDIEISTDFSTDRCQIPNTNPSFFIET